MLYDPRLDVFLACAHSGSFSKAGEELSMTSTGVLKQMAQLEQDLGLQLFNRSHRGLALTEAGSQLVKESRELKRHCTLAMDRLKAADSGCNGEIRIGTSPLTPPALLADLWPKIQPVIPDLSFRLIPFENNRQRAWQILTHLGEEVDVVPGFYDDSFLTQRNCAGLTVCSCPLGIGIPFGHPLWGQKSLKPEDLNGYTLMVIRRGWTKVTDDFQDQLKTMEGISLESFEFFNTETLLKAVNEQKLILAFGIWQGVHPLLDIVEPDWTGTIHYGFLHAADPGGGVRRFLQAVKETHNLSS